MTEKEKDKKEVGVNLSFTESHLSSAGGYEYPIRRSSQSTFSEEARGIVPSYTPEDYTQDLGIYYTRTFKLLEELEKLYFIDPIIQSSVTLLSNSAVDDGFRVVAGTPKYREYITEFLDFMKSEEMFANIISCLLVYGEAFVEIIYTQKNDRVSRNIADKNKFRKSVNGVRVINPKNMLLVRDGLGRHIKYQGRYIAYAQIIPALTPLITFKLDTGANISKLADYKGQYVLFEPDEMIHLKYGELGDTGYGLSPLFALRDVSYQRRQLEIDAVRLMHFYAQPIYFFRLGDEQQGIPANAKDIRDFVAKLNTRKPDEHLVTNVFAQAETLGAFDKALDPVPIIHYMREQTSLGVGVASSLIGSSSQGSFGGGIVESQERLFYQRVRRLQKTIRYGLRAKLFPLICYHQDTDGRTKGVKEGGDKNDVRYENEMMFNTEFMRKIPDIIFNPIEANLDKHKRVVEQFAAGMITLEAAQSIIGIKPQEVEDGKYFFDIEAEKEWELQKKTLDLEQKYAKELTELEAKLMPKSTSPTSSATKKPSGTTKSPRKGKPTSTQTPAKVTEPVGSKGTKSKKPTVKKVSNTPSK